MTDPHRRRGVPERWLLPPGPAHPDLAERWAELEFEHRRALARTTVAELAERSPEDRELVVGLARRRLDTAWRVHLVGPAIGWLVLMTVWGFGRSTVPGSSAAWLLAGLVLGGAAWAVAAARAMRRLHRARNLLAAAGTGAAGGTDPASAATDEG